MFQVGCAKFQFPNFIDGNRFDGVVWPPTALLTCFLKTPPASQFQLVIPANISQQSKEEDYYSNLICLQDMASF